MKLSGAPPTWDEARGLLRELFALAKDTEELAALAFRIPLEAQEITQWVRVSPISVHGEPWLTVLSDICPHTRITSGQAFEYLKQLPFGGLLLLNDVYVFRHSLALAYVDRDQLNHT